MPSKKITTSKKSARTDPSEYKKARPISPVGGGFQGGMLTGSGTGTDR